MSKKVISIIHNKEDNKKRFSFDKSFEKTFNAMINVYANSLNDLNKSMTNNTKAEYGVCCCEYKLRYITPKDVSTYISNLIKGLEVGLFHDRVSDIEMFTVASVKRFIEDNKCEPFETSSALDESHRYVDPSSQTLHDLALLCENDIGHTAVYSNGEITKRLELVMPDVKRLNDIHFTANMKQIVSHIPDVIEKGDVYILSNPIFASTFKMFLQEFLLFACTLNTIAVLQLYGYCHPSVEYSTKPKYENSQDLITECCYMNRSTDYMIRNRIPFNCNMRDIILQDITPNFKDTHDALHFIMRDARSPISILVNKFATKEASPSADCDLITRMFVGQHGHHHDENMFRNDGERVLMTSDNYDVSGFRSKVDWLDNIAFGNNYLDGNYRRDNNGNAHVHPIMNTLDMIYRIFNGTDCVTNEEIANNIVRSACCIRALIHGYNDKYGDGVIENYDLMKDILVLLGEIFTRDCLKLYYNNTRVFTYTDDMPDAAVPGFICMESFVMEAEQQTQNNASTVQQGNASAKPKVSFTNNGQQMKANIQTKTSNVIQRFINWIRSNMAKFSDNFNTNHGKEVEWIKNNMKLNEDIGQAISKGTFVPTVSNFTKFKIPASALTQTKISENVNTYLDIEKQKDFDADEFTVTCITSDENIKKQLNATKDTSKQTTMWSNYVLYSQTEAPKPETKRLSAEEWKELYQDLIQTQNLLERVVKSNSADLDKAAETLRQQLQQLETSNSNDQSVQDKNTKKRGRVEAMNTCIQNVAKIYQGTTLNVLNSKFYQVNYTIYREIVNGYKQQSKTSSQTTNSNDTLNTSNVTGENGNNNNNN